MIKKFWGILSLIICIMLCGACFSACSKAVKVQGTINIEFDGFTQDDISGTVYFSFTGPGFNNWSDTENGVKAVFGPEKTKYKEKFVVDIALNDIYEVDLDVSEKDGKAFNITKRDNDPNDQHFYINIPFAENFDYNLKISKPKPRIKQVDFSLLSAAEINSANSKVRDFLDHSQIWVENKGFDEITNKNVAGFMPLVREQNNEKQFNLAGKYINADMTQENFTLYLKYDNAGKALPFSKSSLEYVFSSGQRHPIMRVAELDGEKVYAFDFQTYYLSQPYNIEMSFEDLEYLSASISDNSGTIIVGTFDDVAYDSVQLYFNRIGWKRSSDTDWQDTALPSKIYGEQLTIKYQFSHFDDIGSDLTPFLYNIFDFAKIKFQINGVSVDTIYDASDKTYTIVLGEFDTPETYSGEYALAFDIGVDRNSIVPKTDLEGVKNVVYSKELEFWKGDENITMSNVNEGSTNHARVYTRALEGVYYPFEFSVINLGMYERFTITINLGTKTYTKEFVFGQDFLAKVSSEGQLAGAYVFEAKERDEIYHLEPTSGGADNLVSYYFEVNGQINKLVLRVNFEQAQTIEAKLSGIEYRTIAFEANGDMYAGGLSVQEDATDAYNKTKQIVVKFDLNKMLMLEYNNSNCNIRVALYSNDVLIGYYGLYNDEDLAIDGYHDDNTFVVLYDSATSNSDVNLKFITNGRVSILNSNDDTMINILITKIVITFDAVD